MREPRSGCLAVRHYLGGVLVSTCDESGGLGTIQHQFKVSTTTTCHLRTPATHSYPLLFASARRDSGSPTHSFILPTLNRVQSSHSILYLYTMSARRGSRGMSKSAHLSATRVLPERTRTRGSATALENVQVAGVTQAVNGPPTNPVGTPHPPAAKRARHAAPAMGSCQQPSMLSLPPSQTHLTAYVDNHPQRTMRLNLRSLRANRRSAR